ncbi:MAG: hypothetical protein M3471_04790 [Actinomycetota bacterium]|nr:hypothetical protein [Actinomycetota bacterium]
MPAPFDSLGPSPGESTVGDGVAPDQVPAVAASNLVAACEAAWAAIQARHPQVPDTVVVLGSGVERGRLVKLGHWWGGQWRVGGEARGEVLLAGEALHLPPEAVFEVLLHEAAHGLNAARGIRDTSRGGRYHNANFKAAAAEVGLKPGRMDPYGWARTALTPSTAEHYAEAITGIEAHMRLARGLPASRGVGVEGNGMDGLDRDGAETEGSEGRDRERTTQRAAECGCEPARKLRMAPSVLARGPVVCGLCDSAFAVPNQAEHLAGASAGAPTGAVAGAVVHDDFVARRRQAVVEEPPPVDLVPEGRARLAQIEAAIVAVAADQPDGELMVAAFAERRAEIAAWFEALVTAEVIELPQDHTGTRVAPESPEPHTQGDHDHSAPPSLDLRTIELPVAEVDRVEEPVVPRREPPAPERTVPEVGR